MGSHLYPLLLLENVYFMYLCRLSLVAIYTIYLLAKLVIIIIAKYAPLASWMAIIAKIQLKYYLAFFDTNNISDRTLIRIMINNLLISIVVLTSVR